VAVKKTIELEVDLKKAQDDIQDIREQFVDLKKAVEGVEKEGKKTTKNIKKGFQGLTNVVKKIKQGFSSMGVALKAIPIAIALEAFNLFKQVLGENQRLSDAFSIALGTVSNVFNDFVNFVLDNSSKVTDFFKAIFEDPLQSIKDLGSAIKANIIERFESALEAIGFLGDAIVKVFKGDFAGAAESAKEAGKELVDVVTGVDDTFDKVANTTEKVVKTLKDVATSAFEGAKAEVELGKAAQIAAAEQEKLRLVNLKAAEEQRQIRDDVSADIDARIEANRKLGKIIEEGIQQELELAQIQADAAAAALANNSDKVELIAEDIRAQALLLEIEERLGGQRSEQLVNETGLLREKLDLQNASALAGSEETLRTLEGQKLIEDGILDRLDLERQVAEEQKRIAQEQFDNTAAIFKEGTIEYENALKERNAAEENFNNINVSLKKQEEEAKLAIVSDGLGAIQSLLGETSVAGKAVAVAQSIINTYQGMTKALGQTGIFGVVAAAGVLASGMASVKKIISTKIPGTADNVGSGGMANTVTETAQAPAFNVVGASPLNQIAETLNNQQPVKAFVVSGDVTTAQQLDRNIISESGI
tara:strand:- start:4539 stop:6308 length:1770 start_codon:yes stop_codon:yes gene_type:complete